MFSPLLLLFKINKIKFYVFGYINPALRISIPNILQFFELICHFFFIKKKRIGSIILYLFKGINIYYSLVNLNGFATHKRYINIKIEGISYTFNVTIKKLSFFFNKIKSN